MGQNDGEIFSLLRKMGEGVVRIDERTQRMDADMREHHADHEARLRKLESDNDQRKGISAIIGAIAGVIVQGIFLLFKHSTGGAQ